MSRRKLTRRQFVAATALSSAAFVSAPFVRTARAAGSLSIGFWDHWVPDANKASTDLVNEWAAKEKVEVPIDYITSNGNKNLVTIASEAQAKSGHDILAMPTWWPHAETELLEPMNDVMDAGDRAERQGQRHGRNISAKLDGKWHGVPFCIGSQIKGPCSRIDLMKKYANIDVQEMYPAGAPPKADNWTLDTFLKAAEGCFKGGLSLWHRPGRDLRLRRYGGRDLPVLRCRARQRQGRSDHQDRRSPPGARVLQEAHRFPAGRGRVLGRRQQQ